MNLVPVAGAVVSTMVLQVHSPPEKLSPAKLGSPNFLLSRRLCRSNRAHRSIAPSAILKISPEGQSLISKSSLRIRCALKESGIKYRRWNFSISRAMHIFSDTVIRARKKSSDLQRYFYFRVNESSYFILARNCSARRGGEESHEKYEATRIFTEKPRI